MESNWAKFRHFVKIVKVLGNFLSVYLVFGHTYVLLWPILMHIFIAEKDPALNTSSNLVTWIVPTRHLGYKTEK